MELHESAQMYLETILVLKNRLGLVRSIDIANEMGFSKPTISVAMKKFRQEGLIEVDESGFISLTEQGRDIAERIYERHQVLTHILVNLGVSKKNAEADACKIEHDISDETFAVLKKEYARLLQKRS
jgi:Mn-dependent DtxR family transcriptional regulator